jgi:hypothetical protein
MERKGTGTREEGRGRGLTHATERLFAVGGDHGVKLGLRRSCRAVIIRSSMPPRIAKFIDQSDPLLLLSLHLAAFSSLSRCIVALPS